jgi:hypothetical protein
MVEVGAGVSVAGSGVLVARKASMAVQDVKSIVIARRATLAPIRKCGVARRSNLVV